MPDQSFITNFIGRVEVALGDDDGPAMLDLAKELAIRGRSETARANRTNKRKSSEKALSEWQAGTGVDPIKLFALATLLHDSATDGRRKWKQSVECALMVLRPDLSHRRAMFRPGVDVPLKLRPPTSARDRAKLDQKRNSIIRKLASAIAYKNGPLARQFTTFNRWCANHTVPNDPNA